MADSSLLRALAGRRVVVAGGRVAGAAATDFLLWLGAHVTVVDANPAIATALAQAGARVCTPEELLAESDWRRDLALVVTSPGFAPTTPLHVAAAATGVPVWGDLELGWQADQSGLLGPPRTWIVITGTNGKTTTTSMVETILRESGRSVRACGNIGEPVITALQWDPRVDYLAVEASSFQLHWAPSLRPAVGAVLNIAEDHLDWHGSLQAYIDAKAQVLTGGVGVVGLEDPVTAALAVAGQRVGFRGSDIATLDIAELSPPGPVGELNAAAAAALTRAVGVSDAEIAAALRHFTVEAHRSAVVATVSGVDFIDDSKATNPHAAAAALAAHERVVWVAGGQLKGASVSELVAEVAPRLAGAVLLGTDREQFAQAIARHAPNVPTVTVSTGDDGSVNPDLVMRTAVQRAWQIARADTAHPAVLLAPAAASLDMFTGYAHRGDAFIAAASEISSEIAAGGQS